MRTIRTILRETGKEGEKIFQESGLTYDQFKEKNKRDIEKLEARNIWVQRTQEFRQRVKESGLSADEYCERQQRELEKSKLTPWQYFKKWLNLKW